MLDGYTTINNRRERSYGPWSPTAVLAERQLEPPPRVYPSEPRWRDGHPPSIESLRSEFAAQELVLQPSELPVLVAFEDVRVPGSGRVIQPDQIREVFPGVKLGRCTSQPTRDRVSFGAVEKVAAWLVTPGRATSSVPSDQEGSIKTGDFVRR